MSLVTLGQPCTCVFTLNYFACVDMEAQRRCYSVLYEALPNCSLTKLFCVGHLYHYPRHVEDSCVLGTPLGCPLHCCPIDCGVVRENTAGRRVRSLWCKRTHSGAHISRKRWCVLPFLQTSWNGADAVPVTRFLITIFKTNLMNIEKFTVTDYGFFILFSRLFS